MTDSPSPTDPVSWSERLSQRYGWTLPPDVASWFDEELWRTRGPGEYSQPVSPDVLLSDCPNSIWPPLMPPFFLPLIGHPGGDWLCLRLTASPDDDGHVTSDICQWYHGGGDWLPWGGTLAEALLLDCVMPKMPGANQLHAIAAEEAPHDLSNDWVHGDWGRWLSRWLPGSHDCRNASLELLVSLHGIELASAMIRFGWADAAVRCQVIIELLGNELQNRVDPKLANRLGIAWNDLMRWCFDLKTLPEDIAQILIKKASIDASALDPSQQDWSAIEQHAAEVSNRATDLAWGHEIYGYCLHRRGEREAAARAWQRGLRCSVFTDQSVRLRTHWATTGTGKPAKFAASFLNETDLQIEKTGHTSLYQVPASVSSIEYLRMLNAESSAAAIRAKVMSEFLHQATDCTGAGDDVAAIAHLLAAGWDLGAEPMRAYADLLDELIATCDRAGWTPHRRLAETHRQCLRSRYGL